MHLFFIEIASGQFASDFGSHLLGLSCLMMTLLVIAFNLSCPTRRRMLAIVAGLFILEVRRAVVAVYECPQSGLISFFVAWLSLGGASSRLPH